jgi:hypothetical protein
MQVLMEHALDELSDTNKSIWSVIGLYKKAPKNQKHKVSIQIINEINDLNKSCMCNMIKQFNSCFVSEEITFAFLNKCKNTCNFCQIKYIQRLQKDYVRRLQVHNYLKIFKFEDLLNDTEIMNILIKSDTLSYQQLYMILTANNEVFLTENIVEKIIKVFIESKYDITKPTYNILSVMLKRDDFVDKYSKLFSTLVVDLVKNDKLSIFDSKNVTLFTNNDVVLNYAIKHCSVQQLESIIDRCTAVSISANNFYDIYYKYQHAFTKKIISKMTNVFSYISYCANKMSNQTINVVVESGNLIKSLPKLNDINVYDDLCGQTKIFMNYIGEVGYDASGLRKDFFTNCSAEFGGLLEECDGYLTIPKNINLNEMEIKFISLMLARSIFVENISLQIRLHPLLTYLMISGGYSIKFEHFYNFISHFEIEFINNTFKLLDLPEQDYLMFMDLQGNDKIKSMTRQQYVMNQIIKKYIHPKLIEFINGFRVFFKSLYFVDFVNPIVFNKYVCGNDSYEIVGNTPHSLRYNLHIIGLLGKHHDMFKKVFIEILEELNKTSIVKLQMFLKYWFATSSIISFSDRTPTIYTQCCSNYDNYNKYHCFYSATCFDKLTITIAHKEFSTENILKSFISTAMNASIENQKIWESTGVHMQLA